MAVFPLMTAGGAKDPIRGLFLLLLFLHVAFLGFDEAYDLFYESTTSDFSFMIQRERFLAPASSRWYRSPLPLHDALSTIHPADIPEFCLEHGSVGLLGFDHLRVGDSGFQSKLDVEEVSKYLGDPSFHQSVIGLTASTALSMTDEKDMQQHGPAELLSSTACELQPAFP